MAMGAAQPDVLKLVLRQGMTLVGIGLASGLAAADVPDRLERHGYNRLPEPPPPSLLKLVLDQIADVTVLALIAAAIIALSIALIQGVGTTLEKYGDTGAIMGIVVGGMVFCIFLPILEVQKLVGN